ncbi:MAG: hypothetical protein IMZ52_02445, partial [Actinobacteria bacterium]|nr:hypothetical protein [Actinomycetota bacterium]
NKSIEYGEFFKDKERKSVNGEIRINPIKYKFKKEIPLDELNKIKNKILKRYIGGVTSFGNPLLMMQFSDVNDGSSYDLYAYHDTIEVVPLDKASSASFSKLASFISDNLPLAEMVGGLNIGHT